MLLDSDVLIDILRGRPPAVAWFAALPEIPPISGIVALELLFGCRDSREHTQVRKFLSIFPILWMGEAGMRRAMLHAPLHLSHSLGVMDALIAETAKTHKQTLATFNVKHFRAIEGLTLVQPYTR